MLNFFGISNKEKISCQDTSKIFSVALNKVIDDGFLEIKEFLNNNNNLEKSPNISSEDIKYFRLIIFSTNLYIISTKFDTAESLKLRNCVLDHLLPTVDKDKELAKDVFLQYETYYNDIIKTQIDPIESAAVSIFKKFKINECQSLLLQRKNEPNPVLFSELKNLLDHFVWNWDEFLDKCKIKF